MSEAGQTARKDIPRAVAEREAPRPSANAYETPGYRAGPNAPHHLDYNPDLDWYLNDAPALLGERSGQANVEAAIERGGGGNTNGVTDNGPYHEAAIAALPAVARARKLSANWERLTVEQRQVAQARYRKKNRWDTGCVVFLTAELVGVAMMLSDNPKALRAACRSAAKNESAKLIKRERDRAQKAVRDMHQAWKEAGKAGAREWAEGVAS
jgi:hypothetical protein